MEVALFGVPLVLYFISFAFSMNISQREKATRPDYELDEVADQVSVNPFKSRTGSKFVGSTWQLVGLIAYLYVYTTDGPRRILASLGTPLNVDVVRLVAYQSMADTLGGLVHVVYFPGLLFCFLVGGVGFFFLSSIPYAVANGLLVAVVTKFKGIPFVVSVPLFVVGAFVFKIHRQIRYLLTPGVATHTEARRLLKPLFGVLATVLGGSSWHFDDDIDWERFFAGVNQRRYQVVTWGSRLESVLLVGVVVLFASNVLSGGDSSWLRVQSELLYGLASERFSPDLLFTVVGVLLILHGRSVTTTSSVGEFVAERVFVTVLGLVAVLGALVLNPTAYFEFLPTVRTMFDVIILLYVPITVALLTVHLLELHPEVAD
ncbi:hypothetical protein C2R22_13695 [Salinigranum rubrum]|uniref:Uncharacterized protein n=2 Tax=Salinigranum rubrum TaxID=755307 RepID=A0A2I8VKX1_9EURY|nr:hypothetical protein C2R22_13695 [Salinigranum rubrum]